MLPVRTLINWQDPQELERRRTMLLENGLPPDLDLGTVEGRDAYIAAVEAKRARDRASAEAGARESAAREAERQRLEDEERDRVEREAAARAQREREVLEAQQRDAAIANQSAPRGWSYINADTRSAGWLGPDGRMRYGPPSTRPWEKEKILVDTRTGQAFHDAAGNAYTEDNAPPGVLQTAHQQQAAALQGSRAEGAPDPKGAAAATAAPLNQQRSAAIQGAAAKKSGNLALVIAAIVVAGVIAYVVWRRRRHAGS